MSRPASVHIRRFRPSADRRLLVELWQRALSPKWPVMPDGVALLRDGFVAERNGRGIGMVAFAIDDGASILLIALTPEEQRHGIGTRLLSTAVDHLRDQGADRVGVGSGAGGYIWPGVPLDLPGADAFFDALGWDADHVVADLVADLQRDGLDNLLANFWPREGVSISQVTPCERAAVLAFEGANFPTWSRWFQDPDNDMVAACDRNGEIVGSLLISGPGSATLYWPMLGSDAATIGCVGVAPTHQGRGIGSAMVAATSSILRRRGAGSCHIGWVARTSFYERLGYEPWRGYSMRARQL